MVRIIFAAILISSLIYLAMFIDTNSVIKQVEDAFKGKIDVAETAGKPLDMYNINRRGVELGEYELILFRRFVLHNFQDGYIWAFYCHKAFDVNGEIIMGSWWIPTKWKIHKEDGEWEIIEVIEAP